MKKLFFSGKALPAVLILIMCVSFAFADKATAQVSFSIEASVSGNVNTGTFTSSGFTLSSGNVIEEYSFNGKKTHSEVTFTYADGSITAKTHSDITLTSSTTATGTGRWIITKGTGAYAGISGSGTLTLAVSGIGSNENIEQEWWGLLK
jgi:hypothetical protein